jgi:hypothetical protein
MKYLADDDGMASLIVENNNESRKLIRQIHQVLRDPKVTDMLAELGFEGLAFTRIVDTVHFAEKGHSSPLQVADACAFAIKRHSWGRPKAIGSMSR